MAKPMKSPGPESVATITFATYIALLTTLLITSTSMSIWEYKQLEKPTLNETRIYKTQIGILVISLFAFLGAGAYIVISNSNAYKQKLYKEMISNSTVYVSTSK